MFRIKICGVRSVVDVENAHIHGADSIGINFFPKSIRYLSPKTDEAQKVSSVAAERCLLRVGVVVNMSRIQVEELLEAIQLDAIQLHGDEPISSAEYWASLGIPLIRAIKLPSKVLTSEEISSKCAPWIQAGCHPLFDADAGGAHGGIGRKLDWDSIRNWQLDHPNQAFTLAGGLTPDNVADAILTSGARSVDTASGVEKPRGCKDSESIRRFVDACSALG